MLKTLSLAVVVAIGLNATSVVAQDKKLTTADFAGTWNIEAMSHQIALVIEPTDDSHVTATMMMMGRDVPLKGELVGRSISLVGVKDPNAPPPSPAEAAHGVTAAPPGAAAKPIVITLLEDGTLSGEMMTNMGPAKWTGEKLKAKKKG